MESYEERYGEWNTTVNRYVIPWKVSVWKRISKRLRSKYRTQLAMERAAHNATKQALLMMVRELSEAVGRSGVDDSKWPSPEKDEKNMS